MEIKVGSKWAYIGGRYAVTVDKFENEVVGYKFDNDLNLIGSCHINTFLKEFKPLEFKLQEWDIVQCRNKSICIMVDDKNKGKLKEVIDTYNLDCVVSNLRNKFISDTDIMKVWRLPDISIKRTLGEQIKNVEPIWVREEKPKSIYDLKDGDTYYYKSMMGISVCGWSKDVIDLNRLELGNVFLTKEECEFSIEEDKVRAIMRKYACTDKEWLNYEVEHYYLYCDLGSDYVNVEDSFVSIADSYDVIGEFMFKTQEEAKKVIDEISEERLLKYYFKVK